MWNWILTEVIQVREGTLTGQELKTSLPKISFLFMPVILFSYSLQIKTLPLLGSIVHADGMIELMNQHTSLNIPMVTVGDFNADSSSSVMQFLLNQTPITYNSTTITNPIALHDSWYVANPTSQKPGTVGITNPQAIDWILTTANTTIISALIDDQGVSNGVLPSDHKPLQITFDLGTTTSGIHETVKDQSLKIYPNPFQNNITLELDKINSENTSIELFDINGIRVYYQQYNHIINGKNSNIRFS